MDRRSFLQLASTSLAPFSLEVTPAAGIPVDSAIFVPAGSSHGPDGKITERLHGGCVVRSGDAGGHLNAWYEWGEPKYGGSPLHVHHGVWEWLYILDGEFVADCGGKLYRLKKGDSLEMPADVPHRWSVASVSQSAILHSYSPAGRMNEFFETPKRRADGTRLPHDELVRIYEQFGMSLLGDPLSKEQGDTA
jgi:hypothetical protein